MDPGEAGRVRAQELRRAARKLGIEVYFLDYIDGELNKIDAAQIIGHIACWIDTVKPQNILTFGPDGVSGHPDQVKLPST